MLVLPTDCLLPYTGSGVYHIVKHASAQNWKFPPFHVLHPAPASCNRPGRLRLCCGIFADAWTGKRIDVVTLHPDHLNHATLQVRPILTRLKTTLLGSGVALAVSFAALFALSSLDPEGAFSTACYC